MSDIVNYERLRSVTGGDAEVENMLFGLFLDTASRVLEQLEAGGDWKSLVHELKGASANLGADDLHKACAAVEYAEPEGEARQAFFSAIKHTITRVQRLIA